MPAPTPAPDRTPPPGFGARAVQALGEVFGLDTRSLAVARVALGILCVLDVAVRSLDLAFFYSDLGAIPRSAVIEHIGRWEHISLYMAAGTTVWVGFLFCVQAAAAACFAVGYRTRLANLVLWVLLIGLHSRGGILLQSGDVLLRLLLFWALWLPMGARLSIDALRRLPTRPAPGLVVGAASLGYGLQLAVVYVFTAMLKSDAVWGNGQAVYYTMHIDHFAKQPFADFLLANPALLDVLTPATWYWEMVGPFLLLVPFLRGPVRTAVVGGFLCLHLGFWAGLEIGLFPWICMAGWVALFPGWLWDRLGWRIHAPARAWLGATASTDPRRWRRALPTLAHNGAAVLFVMLVLNWNMSTIGGPQWSVPQVPRTIGHMLRLDQKWNMFAPYPLKDDGWYAMPGQLADGRWVDVWRGGTPQWATEAEMATWPDNDKPAGPAGSPEGTDQWLSRAKPDLVSAEYRTQRWRKYMRNLWLKTYKDMRLYYGKGLCRQINAERTGDDRLHTFEIWYMKEVTGPPEEGELPVVPVRIWTHYCFRNTRSPSLLTR